MNRNVYRPVVGRIKVNTGKAILMILTDPEALTEEDAELEVWIPKSQVTTQTPMRDVKGNIEVMMSEWIIGQKSLQRFVASGTIAASSPSSVAAKHPPVPTTPPAPSFVDMDSDIPF